jgi:hypothetical protein
VGIEGIRQSHVKEEEKKKVTFVTLSPTKIEVTGFNGLDNRIRDGEGHA